MRERSAARTYFFGIFRSPFLPPLALSFSFFAALRAACSASALRCSGTSFAVASAASLPTWGSTLTFAGYVGNTALAAALGTTPSGTSPEDDPARPYIDALEKLAAQLRRVGNNLNQVARAVNAGSTPAQADHVLDQTQKLLRAIHDAIDTHIERGEV